MSIDIGGVDCAIRQEEALASVNTITWQSRQVGARLPKPQERARSFQEAQLG
jgi:hypothetical protein